MRSSVVTTRMKVRLIVFVVVLAGFGSIALTMIGVSVMTAIKTAPWPTAAEAMRGAAP